MHAGSLGQIGYSFVAGVLALFSTPVLGAPPLIERVPEFFLIEDAFTASGGEIEARSVIEATRLRDAGQWDLTGLIAAERGVGERMAIGASLPFRRMHTAEGTHSGIGDLGLEVLYDVLGRGRTAALLLAFEVTLPTGDESRGLGEESVAGELTIVLAKNFGALQVHLNLGGEFSEEEDAFQFGASMLRESDARFVPTLELAGAAGREGTELYVAPGLHWRVSDEIHIGAGVPIGLTSESERLSVMAMVNVDF